MPTLNWIGKEAVVNHHNEVPVHTLTHTPERSSETNVLPSPATGNLLIEGDNLLALKALLAHYAGKIIWCRGGVRFDILAGNMLNSL